MLSDIRDFDVLDDRTQGVFAVILRGFVHRLDSVYGLSTVVMMAGTKEIENLTSHPERAGAGLGMALVTIWFIPAVGAAALDFLIRKYSMGENCPITCT